MLHVIVLGSAAGGGVPQWNCGCKVCSTARAEQPNLQRTQASVAFSADGANWFLINASPDLRQQINATQQLHPKAGLIRHSPIAGVILTNGEVDAVAGLLSMREGSPFTIYAHPRILSMLGDNAIFNVLDRARVPREPIALDAAFEPQLPDGTSSGIEVTPFAVPGKQAWHLEAGGDAPSVDTPGDTIALRISDKRGGKHFYFVAACARITPDLTARLQGAPLIFFDGTLWRDDEMIALGLSQKTGERMGHVSISGARGTIAALKQTDIGWRIFLHINNSNPVLLPGSAERGAAENAGWQIPPDGLEIRL
jgi:pyrroloquinoline quinone biosynthesis protein B